MKRAEPTTYSASCVLARCLGILLLAVMAFVPMGGRAVAAVPSDLAQEVAKMVDAAVESEEDCEELVSHDMVLCGDEFFEFGAPDTASLMMPREQCQELLDTIVKDLQCDPSDAECRERSAKRGDVAPNSQRSTRVMPMALFAVAELDLPLQRSLSLGALDWELPASPACGPPPRPPRAA